MELSTLRSVIHRLCNSTDHKGRSEHKLILNLACFFILREVKEKASHNRIIIKMYSTCKGINIRHQMITELDKLLDGIIEHGSFFTKVPDFSWCISSMGTEHRKEGSHLQPSCIQLTVSFILHTFVIFALPEPFRLRICVAAASTVLPLISNCKESADIQCPVWISTQSHIQAFHDLCLKIIPGCTGIA